MHLVVLAVMGVATYYLMRNRQTFAILVALLFVAALLGATLGREALGSYLRGHHEQETEAETTPQPRIGA